MKLLLFQYRPAIRCYKFSEVLAKMGHDVVVAYSSRLLPQLHFNCPVLDISQVNPNSFDKFLSFNTNFLPAGITIPVVQCVGDLKSYQQKNKTEIDNLKSCDYAYFVSETQRQQAIKLVPEVEKKSTLIINGLVPSLIPKRLLPKIETSGKLTAVWSGTLSANPADKRYLAPLFRRYSYRFDLHVYPSFVPVDLTDYNGPYTIHKPVSPRYLVAELSKYDVGLILWEKITYELRCTLPNKLYEYLAAGLQVLHNYDMKSEVSGLPYVQHIDKNINREKIDTSSKVILPYTAQTAALRQGLL
jgi:hypothetical protein